MNPDQANWTTGMNPSSSSSISSSSGGGGGGTYLKSGGSLFHGILRRYICHRWLHGQCPFSDLSCPYAHSKEQAPLCQDWVKGFCIGGRGNSCRHRHFYNDDDRQSVQQEEQEPAGTLDEFSSPLVVKIKKFTEEHRRVEVDLETGRRKSWVETEEKEIIDLCGETPAKKPVLPPPPPAVERKIKKPALPLVDSPQQPPRTSLRDISNTLPQPSGSKKSGEEKAGYCHRCKKQFSGFKGLKSHLRQSQCGQESRSSSSSSSSVEVTPPPPVAPSSLEDSCIILD